MQRYLWLGVLGLGMATMSLRMPAQQPAVLHGVVTSEAATGGLQTTLARLGQGKLPVWVGYAAPVEGGFRNGWQRGGVTQVEDRGSGNSQWADGAHAAPAQDHLALLVRMAAGAVTELRTAALDETLDAGGLPVVWLTGVTPEDSIAFLQQLAQRGSSLPLRLRSGDGRATPVFLIALHRSPAAVPALVALTAPGQDLHVREQAAFWLANQRGRAGFEAVRTLARNEKDAGLRQQLTFDLTLTKEPGGVAELIRMAHEDSSPVVRQQAQFWMAQTVKQHGENAAVVQALRADAAADPDAPTRQRAVFAISQLPQEQATTELVRLAQTSTDHAIREQAVFWLGQSKDPKALEYLTQVLTAKGR